MKSALYNADVLLRLPLLIILGFAIFFGCSNTYSHTHTSLHGTSDIQLREGTKFVQVIPDKSKRYTGPQTVQELMKALDSDYNRGHSKTEVSVSQKVGDVETTKYSSNLTLSEIDARYPRTEWLQLLLDRGITIENSHDYSRYLSKRHTLAFLEDNPNLWRIGIHDIPPTDDWETYKAAYIDKLTNLNPLVQISVSTTVDAKARTEVGKNSRWNPVPKIPPIANTPPVLKVPRAPQPPKYPWESGETDPRTLQNLVNQLEQTIEDLERQNRGNAAEQVKEALEHVKKALEQTN